MELCLAADRFDFAMPVHRDELSLRLTPLAGPWDDGALSKGLARACESLHPELAQSSW